MTVKLGKLPLPTVLPVLFPHAYPSLGILT